MRFPSSVVQRAMSRAQRHCRNMCEPRCPGWLRAMGRLALSVRGLGWLFPRQLGACSAPGQSSAAGIEERISALAGSACGDVAAKLDEESATSEAAIARFLSSPCATGGTCCSPSARRCRTCRRGARRYVGRRFWRCLATKWYPARSWHLHCLLGED